MYRVLCRNFCFGGGKAQARAQPKTEPWCVYAQTLIFSSEKKTKNKKNSLTERLTTAYPSRLTTAKTACSTLMKEDGRSNVCVCVCVCCVLYERERERDPQHALTLGQRYGSVVAYY